MRTSHRIIAGIALVALGVQIPLGCGNRRSEPVQARSLGALITASLEPAEPRVGQNTLWLDVRDASGEPVSAERIDARIHMHAMGTMPAMGGPAEIAAARDGSLRAEFQLAMGGTWLVEVEASLPDGNVARADGSLTVGVPGLRFHASGAEEGGDEAHSHESASPRHPAEFQIAPGRLQRTGVRTAPAEKKALTTSVRAVGQVVAEETTLEDISLKVRGWAKDVRVDAVGDPVTRGQVLFSVYSPDLYAAQEEYLQAVRSQERARATDAPERADYLVRAARNRLRLWDIADADLERLAERGELLEHLPIRSPVTGHVVEKDVFEGSTIEPGARLYRIAPLSRVWVEAEVYEYELPLVHAGQEAQVTLSYLPERVFDAKVAYVYPTLDPKTRTARLRLELPNADLALRPGMYANVRIEAQRGERVVVPQSAILYAGERSFVFRALGEGRFRPQQVEVGIRAAEETEILSGVEPGDEIVVSATFLIASESRLRAALSQW